MLSLSFSSTNNFNCIGLVFFLNDLQECTWVCAAHVQTDDKPYFVFDVIFGSELFGNV